MEIWIGRNGERHGPYKEDDVRAWLRAGQVSGSDLAWREGLADWQPLSVLFPDAMPDPASAGSQPPPSAASLPQTTAAVLEDYAGFWKRVAAYIIDAILLAIVSRLIGPLFNVSVAEEALKSAILGGTAPLEAYMQFYRSMSAYMLVSTVITWLYFILCESSAWQATVGKLALGIRVTDMDGRRISFARALGRYAGKYVSAFILLIGFIMVGFTQRKQGLHDLMAGTLVLNGRASEFKSAPAKPDASGGSFNA
jgi:uncharacterized RDD family membrane protein YckC